MVPIHWINKKLRVVLSLIACTIFSFNAPISIGGGGENGTGRQITSFASIQDFGSIWVNGVEFATTTSNIVMNGAPAQPESALKAGMVVRVDGWIALSGVAGTATTVTHNTDLRGAISASPVVAGDSVSFQVHGVPVKTDIRTVVAGVAGAELLAAGNRVEVSGVRDDNTGVIRASRIEVLPATSVGTIVRGVASVVNANTISIGGLSINTASATLNNITMAQIASGVEVRVRASTNPVGTSLVANVIERAEPANWAFMLGSAVETEGVVSARVGTQFNLNGVHVMITAATVAVGGTLADVVNGARVEVKGDATGTSAMNATTIKFRPAEPIDVDGVVVAKSATGALTLFSVANGTTIITNAATEFKDSSNAKLKPFAIAQLSVGNTVRIRATHEVAGWFAARVERINATGEFDLKTRLMEAQSGTMTLGDTLVSTNAATVFTDVNGLPITSAAFYARAIGLHVHVRGTVSGNTLNATSAAIQK